MTTKYIGKGTTVSVGGSAINNIISVTPPMRSLELVDQTALADTLATYAAGVEQHSECVFTHFWDLADTAHDALETYLGNAGYANGATNCVITIPTSANTNNTITFNCFVSSIVPQAIVRDQIVVREVTLQRTGAIT